MMGTWKKRKLLKGMRASRTRSGPARIYYAVPPETGWRGGEPSQNGFRGRK